MANAPTRLRHSPSIFGWFFALLSLGFVTLSGMIGLAVSLDRQDKSNSQALNNALHSRDYVKAKGLVAGPSDGHFIPDLIAPVGESKSRKIRINLALEMISLVEKSGTLKYGSYSAAADRSNRAVASLPEVFTKVAYQWEGIAPLVSQNSSALHDLDNLAAESVAIERESVASLEVFSQIRARFAKLLGLADGSNGGKPVTTCYKLGVFAGLPELPRLEENLGDLAAVRDRLEKLGGKVSVSGDDAKSEFEAELSSIRALTRKIMEDQAKRDDRASHISSERAKLLADSELRTETIRPIIHDSVLALTKERSFVPFLRTLP